MPSSPPRSAVVRVAVIGLGFGPVHVQAFRRDPRCEVVAICGRDGARATEIAKQFGIPKGAADWRALLANEPLDVISMAVPASVQAEIGQAALNAKKHVFFEKPLAATIASAEALARSAEQHGCVTAVNFEFPEIDAWRQARRLLDQRGIGALRHVAITWRVETYANRVRTDIWKARASEGGGALNLFASHSFHYIEWIFGRVRSIFATLERAAGDSREGDTLDTMFLITEDNLPIVLTIATDAFLGPGHRLEVYGDDGTIVLENSGSDYVAGFRLMVAQRGDPEYRVIPTASPQKTAAEDGRIEMTAAIVRRFIDAIAEGKRQRPTPGITEGIRVQQLMDTARLSNLTRRMVDVPR